MRKRPVNMSLDDKTIAWLRERAEERDTSVSQVVRDLVYEQRRKKP